MTVNQIHNETSTIVNHFQHIADQINQKQNILQGIKSSCFFGLILLYRMITMDPQGVRFANKIFQSRICERCFVFSSPRLQQWLVSLVSFHLVPRED